MGVQREELPQLAVYNPPNRAIGILALNPEDSLIPMERVQAVADADPKSMEQRRHPTMSLVVPFEPHAKHLRRKPASDELVGDVHIRRYHCRRGRRLGLGLACDVRKQRAQPAPFGCGR